MVIFVPLLNMTHAAPSFPSFLCDNKLNTTERGAADVMFKKGTEIIRASHCEGAKNNSVVFFWKFALVLRKPKFSLLSTTKFKIQNDHSVEFVGGLSFVQTDAMMLADLWRW